MKTIGTKEHVLSALELALKQDNSEPRYSDEFTVAEYVAGMQAKGINISLRTASGRLESMIHNRLLKKRKIMIGSRFTNLYSKV